MKRIAVLPDLHIPYHDEKVLELVKKIIKDEKIDEILFNGDLNDFAAFSKFTKAMHMVSFDKEREITQKVLTDFKKLGIPMTIIYGNHEIRLINRKSEGVASAADSYLDRNGQDLINNVMNYTAVGVKVSPYGSFYKIGKLYVTHGDVAVGNGGYSAKLVRDKVGQSVMIGHTHRVGSSGRTVGTPGERTCHVGWEIGCLCQTIEWYQLSTANAGVVRDWMQGFVVVDVNSKGFFHVQQLIYAGGMFIFNGKEYTSTSSKKR